MMDTHSTRLIIIFVLATFVNADHGNGFVNTGLGLNKPTTGSTVSSGIYKEHCQKYKHAIYSGRRLDGTVFREIRNTTKRLCGKDCHVSSKCQSINYNKLGLSCQLNWKAVNNGNLLAHSRHWEYVHKQTLLQAYDVGCPTAPCPPNSMCVSFTSGLTTCVVIDCGIAPEGKNTKPLVSRTTTIGHSVKYQCNRNSYFANGIDRRDCMANGQLSGKDIICIPFRCGNPFFFPASRSHEIKCFANGYCTVIYTCTNGRKPQIGCTPSGQWTSNTIYC